jgi:hypothetical protein
LNINEKKSKNDVTFKGRYLGILVLVIALSIVGLMHMFFGLALISGDLYFGSYSTTVVYSVYTLVYGFLTVFFAYLLWEEKRFGWIGTVSISIFVIIVDALAVSNLSNILNVPAPKFATIGEIPFSILILAYLFQDHIISKYDI